MTSTSSPADPVAAALPPTVEQVKEAIQWCDQGRPRDALPILEARVADVPHDPFALHGLGVAYALLGELALAQTSFEKLVEIAPKSATAHSSLGNAFKFQGNYAEAAKAYRKAILLQPEYADAHYNLAIILAETGQKAEAKKSLEHAILFRPAYPEAYNNLGNMLMDEGRVEEAATQYRQALAWNSELVQAQENLVTALHRTGRYDDATDYVNRLLKKRPDDGRLLRIHALGLSYQGKWQEAEKIYLKLLESDADAMDLWVNLAAVRQIGSDYPGALECYEKAIKMKDADVALCSSGIASVLMSQDKISAATERFQQALMLNPRHVGLVANFGRALVADGNIKHGIENIRHALDMAPQMPELLSNLIYSLHFDPSATPETRFAEAKRWNERHGKPTGQTKRPQACAKKPREKLRIGYISADLRDHSVGRCVLPVLQHHDHERFQIICYAVSSIFDEFSKQMKTCSDLWRTVPPLSHFDLAERIRQDNIDILIDLSGHTGGNRLRTFVEQPAPLQMTWLGFFSSTGLDAIDYRITDAVMDPEGQTEKFHSEKLLRLPVVLPYLAPKKAPAVSSPPILRHGHLTFGALTRFSRANTQVLDTWAQILTECNTARLTIFSGISAEDEKALERIYRLFALRDIPREQLDVLPKLPFPEFLAKLGDIDLALDSFPYPGGITTLHSLWMGVPVLTLAGESSFERAGASILTAANLPQFIAKSQSDYVERAIAICRSPSQLTPIRKNLRKRLKETLLLDGAAFTRAFEQKLVEAWESACSKSD